MHLRDEGLLPLVPGAWCLVSRFRHVTIIIIIIIIITKVTKNRHRVDKMLKCTQIHTLCGAAVNT